MELVSVIIPTFNSEQFISTAIDSVIAQRYSPIEIVVADDGSTDNTVSVAGQKLQGGTEKFKVLKLGTQRGPSAARNAGLRVASGTWVQFLDSDDILMPAKIERQMAVCVTASSDVAAIYSPWNWGFWVEGQIEWLGPVKKPFISGKAPIMCLAGGCRPLLAACLIRRAALDRVGGFDEALRFWECEEACVKLAGVGAFVPVSYNEAEYLWRLDKNGVYVGASGARYKSGPAGLGWIKLALKVTANQGINSLGLPEPDRQLLLRECTYWGRLLYWQDRGAFREYMTLAEILAPNLMPSYPRYISTLSRWIGYEKAEAVTKLTQHPKTWVGSALRYLRLRRADGISSPRRH
jgi:glycosyltransferase involved in cell wall biosynthesis